MQAESINFMTNDAEACWRPVHSAMLYYLHNSRCSVFITHAFLDVNRLAERLRADEEHKERALVPDETHIAPALPIRKTRAEFPKYKQADRFISRSFLWGDRDQLRSRLLNSVEYDWLHHALSLDVVYPCLEEQEEEGGVVRVCPVRYEGEASHVRDELVFSAV